MGQHVLVVGNEAITAMVLEEHLGAEGFRVTLATNGEAALTAFRQEMPDVVITDLNTPYLNGAALMRRMRETRVDLPILVMTGYWALPPDVECLCHALPEITPVFEKPVDLDLLLQELQRVSGPS